MAPWKPGVLPPLGTVHSRSNRGGDTHAPSHFISDRLYTVLVFKMGGAICLRLFLLDSERMNVNKSNYLVDSSEASEMCLYS